MTDPTANATIAGTIRDLAIQASGPTALDAARIVGAVLPEGWRFEPSTMERLQLAPWRARGKYVLRDVESFLAYVELQGRVGTLPVYLDVKALRATAIFDDHQAPTGPGWRDHQAILQFGPSDDWQAWEAIDRKLLSAEEFADHVDMWRHTIADPPTADLLDLIRNFRATKKVTYGAEHVEKSGDVALEWSEETTAGNTRAGRLEVPDGFGLVLAPFDGAEPVALPARFRYRVADGTARFGVILEQPARVQRDAYDAEIDRIREAGAFTVMVGTPDTGA